MYHQLGAAVYKRAMGEQPTNVELPTWFPLVVILDFILLAPVWVFTFYTLRTLYPTFAIIEDENPPAYEPLGATGDNETGDQDASGNPIKITSGRSQTVTSSIRSIFRLLRANGGIFANFRGLTVFIVQMALTNILMGIFSSTLGSGATPIATLLATLALVQFNTAWVHIAITPRSGLHFWNRLPPFKRTFEAVWKPVTLVWVASEVARWAPLLFAYLFGIELPEFGGDKELPELPEGQRAAFFTKSLVVFMLSIVCSVFIVIPAHVILVRVQASLLPTDDETVIPFDGSFEGRIEPAIVGGRGYATISDAWATFSKGAWRRLIFLYVKVTAVSLLVNIVAAVAIILPSTILIIKNSKVVGGQGPQ